MLVNVHGCISRLSEGPNREVDVLTADHRNALWLASVYRGGEAIRKDSSLRGYDITVSPRTTRQIWVQDPSGNVIEFISPAAWADG
jgi:hypothetical protein